MGGGLMQLVAYGAQDIYLTGNPQITFFKVVYRRHTNFSMEAIRQTFDGTSDFGNKVTATIARNGDLIHRMYLEHDASFETVDSAADGIQASTIEHYGHSLIKECEIEIGGQKIDKHYAMWNRVHSDLTEFNPSGHFGASISPTRSTASAEGTGTLYQLMTGNGFGLNTNRWSDSTNDFSGNSADGATNSTVNGFTYYKGNSSDQKSKIVVNKIFLPLNFWFCRNPGLSLPLIALQYHEVKVIMTFETLANLVRGDFTTGTETAFTDTVVEAVKGTTAGEFTVTNNFDLYCDYIYLDTDERRRFAQVSHEYLIEQVQHQEFALISSNDILDITLNHPVKEIIWTMRNVTAGGTGGRNQPFNGAGNEGDATSAPVSIDAMGGNWQLKLNGQDRFKERKTKYFTKTQVWQHHTGYGGITTSAPNSTDLATDLAVDVGYNSIAVYSFALKPEEHQPSGTCNFSRIDSAQLVGTSLQVERLTGSASDLVTIGETGATNVELTLFAVNYNVLRIMSGMGGLAYSN